MTATAISLVLAGAILLGYLIIAAFFLRFWVLTRERLFACFAVAFAVLALERLFLLLKPSFEHSPETYLTRLLAFLVIIGGIWDKNRARKS